MDEDLAFCLQCFVEEQIEETSRKIDADIREIEIEQTKLFNEINEKENVIVDQENEIIEQFSNELQKNQTELIENRHAIENDLSILVNRASMNLDHLAGKATSREASDDVRTASNRLRRQTEQFDGELTQLIDAIDRIHVSNCSTRLTSWFEQHFKYLEDLRKMIDVNDCEKMTKDLLVESSLTRQRLWEDRQRLIEQMIEQLNIDDPIIELFNEQHISSMELLRNLREFLQQRRQKQRDKDEEPLQEMRNIIEGKRAKQQVQRIQLVEAIRQLAIGSPNVDQFDQRFREVLNQENVSDKFIPIVIGQINQPKDKELPLMMRLEADFEAWSTNRAAIRQQFCATLSNSLGFPKDTIRITRVEQGSTILRILIVAPYGQDFLEKFSGTDSRTLKHMESLQKCCKKFNSRICSVTLGETGLDIQEKIMDPRWNRTYTYEYGAPGGTFWTGSIDRGGKPYFCPKGWTRYGIKRAATAADFDQKWGSWNVVYHGTKSKNALLILLSGLRSSVTGCFQIAERSSVYATPSIEYAAHPRYACPWQKKGDQNSWYQLVFQCRVNPASVKGTHPETLLSGQSKGKIRIDENFLNDELTWLIPAETAQAEYLREHIVCYGLMIRKTNCNPQELPASHWWQHAGGPDFKYDSI